MSLKKLIIACFLFFTSTNQLIAAPVITTVSPSDGPISGGTVVNLTGSGFTGTTAVVIGSRAAVMFNVISDTSLSAVVPEGTSGAVDIRVTASAVTSAITHGDIFTYTEDSWKGIASGTSQNALTLFDTATNTIDSVILLPQQSLSSIITPDGTTIYAANYDDPSVTVIDVATRTIIDTIPTTVGNGAFDTIVSPDGKKVYVSNNLSGYITVIDTATNTVDANIFVAVNLGSLSITPDGSTIYVGNYTFGNVTTIDTATNTVGTSVTTGLVPGMISITPDGTTAYVANSGSDTVTVIDIATNTISDTINFPSGAGPYGSSIIPIGTTMYVANVENSTVSVVDIATNVIVDTITLAGGSRPFWVVSTPDSTKVYVINEATDDVTPIDVATNTAGPSFANVLGDIQDVVMSPDQAPVASFFVAAQPVGFASLFDASASISPIGTISSYAWDFGDATTATTTSPVINHTYTSTGSFNVVLTVTNSAGTSTTKVWSSRFVSNNGGSSAVYSQLVSIAPSPPINVTGYQKCCTTGACMTDCMNTITWTAPIIGETPVAYRIYRNAALTNLVATIPASGPLEFVDHNRIRGTTYTYFVVSVSSTGTLSSPVAVTVDPVSGCCY